MITETEKLNFKPTNTMIAAAEAVFMAKAYVETIKPVINKIQRDNLDLVQARDEKQNVITEPSQSYHMDDLDFKTWWGYCAADYQKVGFKVPSLDYCPLLMAEEVERKAKRNLAQVMLEYLRPVMPGLTLEMLLHRLADYNQFIELNLKLLAPYVKNNKKGA